MKPMSKACIENLIEYLDGPTVPSSQDRYLVIQELGAISMNDAIIITLSRVLGEYNAPAGIRQYKALVRELSSALKDMLVDMAKSKSIEFEDMMQLPPHPGPAPKRLGLPETHEGWLSR